MKVQLYFEITVVIQKKYSITIVYIMSFSFSHRLFITLFISSSNNDISYLCIRDVQLSRQYYGI